ncbi:hypothetical protein FGG79_05120 [Bacillus sp. BHET2]|uniref:S-Ena type endospore appendage n=1 Tax=Bacillus sp. BHET2 TaxID=2583818 RepID=UPI00110D3B28|nr:S-Ena type endospore appendage [Bacillus sp. BHET2]TMU87508.1 hypothetical protein FGG79_05120 [Bacillus sp. BHET2]
MNCYNTPLGWKDDKCPPRPKKECKNAHYENCAPFAGTGNQDVNTIFDVQSTSIPVIAAGTIENFSTQAINVRFERSVSNQPIVLLVQPHSSLTFVYDHLTRIATTGTAPERMYNGSLKIQLNYSFETTCKE